MPWVQVNDMCAHEFEDGTGFTPLTRVNRALVVAATRVGAPRAVYTVSGRAVTLQMWPRLRPSLPTQAEGIVVPHSCIRRNADAARLIEMLIMQLEARAVAGDAEVLRHAEQIRWSAELVAQKSKPKKKRKPKW